MLNHISYEAGCEKNFCSVARNSGRERGSAS